MLQLNAVMGANPPESLRPPPLHVKSNLRWLPQTNTPAIPRPRRKIPSPSHGNQ
jgi:hypothetical protein